MTTTKKSPAKNSGAGKPSETSAAIAAGIPSLDDFAKLIEKYRIPGVDMIGIVEVQRKDMEALIEANKLAYEGIKTLEQRRNEILRDALVEWRAALDEAPESSLPQQAERARKGIAKAVADVQELAELEAASRQKAWKVVQGRFEENLANLKKLLQPK